MLKVDGNGEELAFEATLRHREVDVRDQGLGVWRGVFAPQTGGGLRSGRAALPLADRAMPITHKKLCVKDPGIGIFSLQETKWWALAVVDVCLKLAWSKRRCRARGCGRISPVTSHAAPPPVKIPSRVCAGSGALAPVSSQ